MNALHLSRPRAMVVAAATFLPLVALATPASAATTVNFDCQANAPIVGPQKVTFTQDADVTAPATVAPGGALDLVDRSGAEHRPGYGRRLHRQEHQHLRAEDPDPGELDLRQLDADRRHRTRLDRTDHLRLRRRWPP